MTDDASDANGKPSLKEASQRVWHEVSETVVQGAQQVATESDYWFLMTLRGLNRGRLKAKAAAAKLGTYALDESAKLRASWFPPKTQRERIRAVLLREAKRAKLTSQEFETFSEQIASLVELVLQGTVKVSDIAFEHDERLRSSGAPHREPQ